MLLVMVWLLSYLFGASQLPKPSIQLSSTSYLAHGNSWPRPPFPVVSVRQASSGQPKALHAVLYRFGDCAHHPLRFIIFAQLAKLCIFFMIIFDIPILLFFGTCKIAQTVSDSIQHLRKCCFRHHQQKTFPSGRNGSIRVDALRQSRQRHPSGRLLRTRLLRRRQVWWYLGIIEERYGWCGRNCVTERRRCWKTRRKRRDGGGII